MQHLKLDSAWLWQHWRLKKIADDFRIQVSCSLAQDGVGTGVVVCGLEILYPSE